MASPVNAQADGASSKEDATSKCEKSFLTTLDSGGQFAVMNADSVAVLDTGAAANLACSRMLERPAGNWNGGAPHRAKSYPACARFKFDDGRLEGVRCAPETPVGTAGDLGKFANFVLEAGIPALFR